jgi:uncharacterized protein (TIGR03437 family)
MAAPRLTTRPDVGEIAVIDTSGGVVIEPNPFDLQNRSVSFTPGEQGYTAQTGPLNFSEEARERGIPIALGDDDAQAVAMPFAFPFFDQTHSEVFVHSDGNVTFEEPETGTGTRSLSRAVGGPPRIAPLFADLDPSRVGARVSAHATVNRLDVTWDQVPPFTSGAVGARQIFQLTLHRDGRIEFHLRSITLTDAVVGIMPGRLEGEPTAADLSEGTDTPAPAALAEIFSSTRSLDIFAAAQKFYLSHEDAYDFLVLFNAIGLRAGLTAFAFEVNVRNEATGIGDILPGREIVDFGQGFGSPRRLQSFMNMGPLTNYPADPTARIFALGENNTLSVLTHEAGHRFLAYVQFEDPITQLASSALLGRQLAHWSFYFNSDASVLEGNRIADQAPASPRFATTAAVEQFSELDQYLMGLRAPEEISPTFLVENPRNSPQGTRSPASPPRVGVTFDGDRKNIDVDLVIAEEGPRIPDESVSQRQFNFAFVLLVDEGAAPAPADIAKLEEIRTAWEPFFEEAADERAEADTDLVQMLHLSTWPAGGVVMGSPGIGAVEIASPRGTDLEVLLSTDNGGVTVPPMVTIPAGETAASFSVEGIVAGVTRLTAAAATGDYDVAQALVQVEDEAGDLRLEVVSGRNQVGGLGGMLPEPVVLRVVDGNRLPYSGVPVLPEAGRDGVATPPRAISDARGEVSVSWRLATTGELNTLISRLEAAPLVRTAVSARALGPVPFFTAEAVVNAAGFNLGPSAANLAISPGGLITIFGEGLAVEEVAATTFPIPTELGSTVVTINGTRAFLLYVSPSQINLQTPFELTGPDAEIVVTTPTGTTEAVNVPVGAVQPGVFFDPESGIGAILNNDDGSVVWDRPARAGSVIVVFCTGLGAVEPRVESGAPAPDDPPAATVFPVEVRVGEREAAVSFSGLAPGFAGLYQLNVILPADLPPGRYVLVISVNGLTSNEVLIDVE